MKFLVYTDLQATDGHERLFSDPTKSLQLWRVKKFYEELHRIYKENDCDGLWDLGDTTDDRVAIPIPAIDVVLEGLELFPESDYNFKLIGNHEQYLRSTTLHSGRMFRHRFSVVHENTVVAIKDRNVLLCPFPESHDQLASWISQNRCSDAIILGHFAVSQSWTNSGMTLSGIDPSVLDFVDLGLFGHFHMPQTLPTKRKNLHYVGSPFQQDFGETGESKRVGIVDTTGWTVEWVPITGFPVYRTVDLKGFKKSCTGKTEDRFNVVLKSPEEAEEFYALPTSKYANETVYNYEKKQSESQSEEIAIQSTDDLLRQHITRYPPEKSNVTLNEEDMLSYGKEIAAYEE